MRRPKDKLMAGIDLHGNNIVIGIINQDGKRISHVKLPCKLDVVDKFLRPHKEQLESLAVESTFNWYWLVDGLRGLHYPIHLANPAKIQQYDGIKHADDEHDAFHLAELQRLKILPKGYIYDPQLRPVRDLLRRRTSLVQQRTSLILSFKSLHARTKGQALQLADLKRMTVEEGQKLYEHPADKLITRIQLGEIARLGKDIKEIESMVMGFALKMPILARLMTLPGVGKVLGMTIAMEVGEIGRFEAEGNFASYCRAVDSRRLSNGKVKGENNAKCGNKYLSWAFVEAAQFAKRGDPACRRWYDRKKARTSTMVATKALACKLAKAAWHMMSEQADYDGERMFPKPTMKKK